MAQGSIRPRTLKSGRVVYDVYVDLPRDEGGKRRLRKRTFQSKRDAEKGKIAWLAEIDRGTAVDRSAMTVAEMMHDYLHVATRHNVRATTLEGYERTIRVHIIPALGHIKIQKLSPSDVERFYTGKIAAGCSRRQLQLSHFHLARALKRAVRLGLVARNVAEAVSLPRGEQDEEMKTWDATEARRFMEVTTQSYYGPLWTVLLATGMRCGEVLGLRWQDVDFERHVLHVRQSVVVLHNAPAIQAPKTRNGRRDVDVPAAVIDALREHKRVQNERRLALGTVWQDHDLVFCTSIGTPVNAHNLKRDFRRLASLAGVPRIRIHDLRHTYATLALASGVDPTTVSRSLGHARVSITMDIYAHALPNKLKEAADKIGALLFGRRAGG